MYLASRFIRRVLGFLVDRGSPTVGLYLQEAGVDIESLAAGRRRL